MTINSKRAALLKVLHHNIKLSGMLFQPQECSRCYRLLPKTPDHISIS